MLSHLVVRFLKLRFTCLCTSVKLDPNAALLAEPFPKSPRIVLRTKSRISTVGFGSGVGSGCGVGFGSGFPTPLLTRSCTASYLIPSFAALSSPLPNSPAHTLAASSSLLIPGNGSTGAGATYSW